MTAKSCATTVKVATAITLGLLAGACGRGDDSAVNVGAEPVAVTTTTVLDDNSDLPPIPEPIDPATIPPGPRLTAMGPAQLAKLGFVLTEPRGVPKIGKDLAAVIGLHEVGAGVVTDVVLARVENGHGVGSCELCWVVGVKMPAPIASSGPAPTPGQTPPPPDPIDPSLGPKIHSFVLIDAMTGAFITGWM